MSGILVIISIEYRDLVRDLRIRDRESRVEDIIEAAWQDADLLWDIIQRCEVWWCECTESLNT